MPVLEDLMCLGSAVWLDISQFWYCAPVAQSGMLMKDKAVGVD